MKRPLVGLVVVYASGIWLGSLVAWPQTLLGALVLALLGAFFLLSRTRLSHMTLLALVLAGGMLACRHAMAAVSPDSISRVLGLRDQNALVRGAIISDPGYRADKKTEGGPLPSERHNFKLQVTALMQTGSWQSAEGVLWMSVDERREQGPVRYGDMIECSMLLRVPSPARNPGEFDWRGWLTRGDEAHAAGLTMVAREIPAAQVVESGVPSRSKFYSQWLEALRDGRIVTHTVRAGDEMMAGDRLRVRVLNPPRDETADRSDDNSLVLLLEYGPTRLLLMSDAGATVEDRLLGSGVDLRARIIIKGRPGKESSCTGRFLDVVRPEDVVQVVNVRPSDRYLQPDLVVRLQQRGITLYRTDESGAVILRITPRGCTVRPWLP